MKEFIKLYKSKKLDWHYTGFLTSLAPDQEPQVIELFEKGMQHILKNDIDDVRNGLILPIIRKIYVSLVTHDWVNDNNKLLLYNLINIDDLINDIYLQYKKSMGCLSNFEYIDRECEFCSLFTKSYIGKLSKEFFKNKSDKEIILILNREDRLKKII
jgi:hypothetical protein